MDVKTLCLGVLTQGNYTGYDIKKYFERSFSHYFPAGYGSIYPALAYLLSHGLVDCVEQAQTKLPDKKIYNITAAGQASFQKAIAAGNGSHKMRSEFLVQSYFADFVGSERMATIIDERLKEIETQKRALTETSGNQGSTEGQQFTDGFVLAILDASEKYLRSNHSLITHREGELSEVA